MLNVIIAILPYLGLAIVTNIVLGLYNSLERIKERFSWKKLLLGIVKAAIISEAFVALALIFDKIGAGVDMGIFEVAPDVLIYAALALYVGKCIQNIKNIFALPDEKISEIKSSLPPFEGGEQATDTRAPSDRAVG